MSNNLFSLRIFLLLHSFKIKLNVLHDLRVNFRSSGGSIFVLGKHRLLGGCVKRLLALETGLSIIVV